MRLLQAGLNTLLQSRIVPLQTDGIIGSKSRRAVRLLREDVLRVFDKKGYKRHASGCELVGIRMGDFENTFKDIGLIIIGNQEYAFEMSTVAGLYGQGCVTNPNWIQERDGRVIYGVGVVKEGQYVDCYSLQGAWWSGEDFLWQKGVMEYYRDGDRDTEIDRGEVFKSDTTGFNFHSWKDYESEQVNNLSQGCQVVKASVWNTIVEPLLYKLHEAQKGLITYTLLNKTDFISA